LTSLKETTIRQAATRQRELFEDIVQHFTTKVDPNGVKGQIVTFDWESCLLYKTQLDKLLLPEASAVVMTVNANEPQYRLSSVSVLRRSGWWIVSATQTIH